MKNKQQYNGSYSGREIERLAYPLGGIGAGMLCLHGHGGLGQVSLRHKPEVFAQQQMFAALHVKQDGVTARVLEGPLPPHLVFGGAGTGNGGWRNAGHGLPRFDNARFQARFPFGVVTLDHPDMPLACEIEGWSPFVPGDVDASSLPFGALIYRFRNPTPWPIEAVFSFHASNFLAGKPTSAGDRVATLPDGFVLAAAAAENSPAREAYCAVSSPTDDVAVDAKWFRGSWFDAQSLLYRAIREGLVIANPPPEGEPSHGGSLYVPFTIAADALLEIPVLFTWYAPGSDLREGHLDDEGPTYRPHYATRFDGIETLTAYVREHYAGLLDASRHFSTCFFDTSLPGEIVEAVAANLTILKSPTVLRESGGRIWAWEGCCDGSGCCAGSCTHVWNYAQALPHLFPGLERSLRQTEFHESQDEQGHQAFRSAVPIGPTAHDKHAAADGQLGGIMKVHREWRIGGDTEWLREIWPRVKQSLDYCIGTWDPDERGALFEPHHNTYDIEFWGPDGMCTSFYLGALVAAARMAAALGDDATRYRELYARGRAFMEEALWNGEYFIQRIMWEDLRAADPTEYVPLAHAGRYSPEAEELVRQEGPKYQYGNGCLADGVLGAWMAVVCGLGEILDPDKVRSHLLAVYRHNLRHELSEHFNPQRPSFAIGCEGGLLLCTWPHDDALTLPFPYSNEVWTGIEYQVASHCMHMGLVEEGRDIVRTARDRYNSGIRNPFNEYECGHWYARAMSSYGMLQTFAGVRYDAVDRVLTVAPPIEGDVRVFLATATGYGTAGIRNGEPFVDVVSGIIPVDRIVTCQATY